MEKDLTKTAEYWGNFADTKEQRYQWFSLPLVHTRINEEITGDPNLHWIDYTLKKYFSESTPITNCLSLGCGTGQMERILAERNAFINCDAFDVSGKSIEIAKELAKESNIRNIKYQTADINNLTYSAYSYQLAIVHMAMHHFDALEYVTQALDSGLTDDGLLVLLEYVGPNHFQFAPEQKEITNHVLQLLPKKFRLIDSTHKNQPDEHRVSNKDMNWYLSRLIDKIRDRDLMNTVQRRIRTIAKKGNETENIKSEVTFPTLRDVTTVDPSEAIRSSEILNVLSDHFEIVEKKDWGGNIIQFMLDGIANNFADENDADTVSILNMIFNIENTLISTGVFESDFAYVVAKPKR